MPAPPRPLSVLSKGERNLLSTLDTDGLLMHYEDTFASRISWRNGPDGMDPSWPERMIFRYGLLGEAEAFGAPQLCGGSVGLKGIYSQPLNWFPKCDGVNIPEGWMSAHEGPTVYYPFIMRDEIEPLCELMAEAFRCLRQNIKGMAQPIVIQGTIGAELNVKEAGEAIEGYRPVIYTLDRTSTEAKTLDLGGQDHTESLIKTINDLDCEILARMGIKSAGTEKASGVTAEETLSITQELRLRIETDLEKRRLFCEAVAEYFPGLEAVPRPGLMPEEPSQEEGDAEVEDER